MEFDIIEDFSVHAEALEAFRNFLQQPSTTTVSLTLIHYAARTSIQFSDDVASEHEAQGGDGIGHVALRALGCRAGCNLGVGKVFLIE